MAVIEPLLLHAGALQQARQGLEHAGGVALPRRRLPRREADLAPRARVAGHAVDEEEHARPLRCEPLGDRGRGVSRLEPEQRRGVARRRHDDALREPFGPEALLDELPTSRPRSPTSATTATSQRALRAICPSSVDFPTPGAGEEADPLPLADGQQPVQRADPERQRLR